MLRCFVVSMCFSRQTGSWATSYSSNWRCFGRLKLTFWILLAFMPAAFTGFVLVGIWLRAGQIAIFLIPLYVAVWLILGLRVDRWKCPRCGARFSRPVWGGGPNTLAPLGKLLVRAMSRSRRPYLHLPFGADDTAKNKLQGMDTTSEETSCSECGLQMN
jgi:hypothetical protein